MVTHDIDIQVCTLVPHDVTHDIVPRHMLSTTPKLVPLFPTISPTTCFHDMLPRWYPRQASTTYVVHDTQACTLVPHDGTHDRLPRHMLSTTPKFVPLFPTMSPTTVLHDMDVSHDILPRHGYPCVPTTCFHDSTGLHDVPHDMFFFFASRHHPTTCYPRHAFHD